MTTHTNTPNENSDRWEYIKHLWIEEFRPLWFVPGLLLGVCLGFIVGWLMHDSVTEQINKFFEGALPEIMSIGLTITVLFYLDQWRQGKIEEKRLQEKLLGQIRSRSNDVAISAIDQRRTMNWPGLLKNHSLRKVQWKGADLREFDLSGADLMDADLSGADLRFANLSGADLRFANLSGADLRFANLSDTHLAGCNLSNTEMFLADFSRAFMHLTNLRNAKMWYVNLCNAKMDADARNTYLYQANLENANVMSLICDENTVLPDHEYFSNGREILKFTGQIDTTLWRSDYFLSPAYDQSLDEHPISSEDIAFVISELKNSISSELQAKSDLPPKMYG